MRAFDTNRDAMGRATLRSLLKNGTDHFVPAHKTLIPDTSAAADIAVCPFFNKLLETQYAGE